MNSKQTPEKSMVPYFIIWAGQAISLIGSSLVRFALIWWLTKETNSPAVLAMASLVTIAPPVFLSPIIGTLVDRWNRRHVLIVADGAIALTTLVLALFFALDVVEVWIIFVMIFIRALGTAFHGPAMMVSTTLMVPKEHYARIAGLNQALFGAIGIVAPPLGALLLDILPMQGILAIDVVTALLAIVPLFFIAIPQPERSQGADAKPSVMDDLKEGLRYILAWPGLMMLIGVYAMVHLFLRPSTALMPLLVTDHFDGGAGYLASFESAIGIGLVVGGLALGAWGGFKRRIVTAMLALAVMGGGFLIVGLAPATAFPLAVVGMFVIGVSITLVSSLRVAILQATVPPEMQGRVITVALHSTALTDPIGLAIAAPLTEALGVQIWYVLCGIITIVVAIGSFFVQPIMHLEDRGDPASEPVQVPAAGGE